MITVKILIRLSSHKCSVATTEKHRGSKEYQALIEKGYNEAATVKCNVDEDIEPLAVRTFVDPAFFEPRDKYQKIE